VGGQQAMPPMQPDMGMPAQTPPMPMPQMGLPNG
jgi:hypothetical protein